MSDSSLSPESPGLRLRVIQAAYGDCLILESGTAEQSHFILIDGGPDGVFSTHLKPELQSIAQNGGRLDLMVLTHVDEDHVVGLVDFLSEQAQSAFLSVDRMWHNTFRLTLDENDSFVQAFQNYAAETPQKSGMQEITYGVSQGEDLWKASKILEIPLNPAFPGGLVTLETAPRPVEIGDLKLWVFGPSPKNLDRFKTTWDAWYKLHKNDPFSLSAARKARDIDNSVSNISSIMFLVEGHGRSMLLTGDGKAEDILSGLRQIGKLDTHGKLHVDVLKVQHHGSARNICDGFFDKITSRSYVISAGKHKNDGNPDLDTLVQIVTAAYKRGEEIDILVTNPNDSTNKLPKILPSSTYGYNLTFLKPGVHSVVV